MGKVVLYEGPDISGYQGNVNVKAVRDAGYKCVGIRAGYGRNNVDQKYIANAEACANLGMAVLLYWFSYALSAPMAAAEAGFALAQAKKFWKSCPIAYDLEYATVNYARKNGVDITRDLATDMAIAFLGEVRKEGFIPVLYTNRDFLRNYFDMERINAELGPVYVWFALYSKKIQDSELQISDVWQYTSKGRIAGISGNVDLNRFYTNFADNVLAEREPKVNLNIRNFQIAANADGYRDQDGKELTADGIDGRRTQYVRGQINLKAKRTVSGYRAGSAGAVVRWLQTRLTEMGYPVTVDGMYGKNTRAAVIRFQKDHNLKADGVAGYNTIQAMFYY